jgi:hypothetical protein
MNTITKVFVMMTAIGALSACGGGGNDEMQPKDVVRTTETLAEGVSVSFTLEKGTYAAEITSSNNGVIVEWVGGTNCPKSPETKTYAQTCSLGQRGQLIVSNPTLLGTGGAEIAAIKVTSK